MKGALNYERMDRFTGMAICALPSALSEIALIITKGIWFSHAACAIAAPSISVQYGANILTSLSFTSPSEINWSPLTTRPSNTPISDKADGSAHMDYSEFEAKAIEHTVRLVEAAAAKLA